jgi:Fic family protein
MAFDLNVLTEKLEQLNRYRPLSKRVLEQIEHQKKIDHIWSSNAIEGNTLSWGETAKILEVGATIHGAPVKDIMEVLDLGKAYDYMIDLATKKTPITQNDIKFLNRLTIIRNSDDMDLAGQYRNVNVYPYGMPEAPYTDYHLVQQEMDNLTWWEENVAPDLHPVAHAVELHQRFVTTHPFYDGNGRTARLLMEFTLTKYGYPITNIQPNKESREKYINTLSQTQITGDVQPFIDLVASYVEQELDERIDIARRSEKEYEAAQVSFAEFDAKHPELAEQIKDIQNNQNKGRSR